MSAGPRPRVSAIIVSFNTRDLTLEAVRSVLHDRSVERDVWVVDNASSDGSAEAVRRAFPDVRVLALEENVGFGAANNLAMERADGGAFLLLNSDARLSASGDLRRLLEALDPADVGVLGPALETPTGDWEPSARRFPSPLREIVGRTGLHRLLSRRAAGRYLGRELMPRGERAETDWVTGACMLVRREVWEQVGGFDPAIFLYGEEQEWCWRIRRAGWRVVYDPSVRVVHVGRASSGGRDRWRVRRSLAGDLHLLRKHRSLPYRLAFWAVRCLALVAEAALFGLRALGGGAYPRSRSAEARLLLAEWWSLGPGGAAVP